MKQIYIMCSFQNNKALISKSDYIILEQLLMVVAYSL